jgi:adenylyltransferase/sulfurtransferase
VPSCAEGGVLGVLPGIIAMIQATETIKLLTGLGNSLAGRLLLFDALSMEWSEFRLRKDPDCPACGKNPSVTELIDYEGFCGLPSAADSEERASATAFEVKARLRAGREFLLLDVREPDEFERAHIEGSRLIPLGELEQRLHELDDWKQRSVVVHCHSGVRSARACRLLTSKDFRQVENLDGGIEAWSLTVDPEVPRY